MNSPGSPTPSPSPYPSVPPPAEPAGPGLSEPQRLIDTFVAPSKTFTDLRRNASWWVPWLVTAIISLTFGIVGAQKLDMQRFIEHEIEKSPSAQRRMEQLTPAQREAGIALQAKIVKGFFYVSPVINLVGGIIIAAILMVVFNFMMGAEVPFQRAMAVVFYSYLPFAISGILLTLSFLVSSDPNTIDINNPMPTNPGFFMDPMGNRFLYAIASSLDIFTLWVVVLLGLGFSLASSNRKPKPSTGITTMLVVFAIFVIGRAAWRAMF